MKETTFEEQSSLKIYSLGIVIKAAVSGNKDGEIMVSPIEAMNVQPSGIIANNGTEFRGGHPDEKGVSGSAKVKSQNYVKAKWIALGDANRVTAPTVYPNETVLLYRYGNHDVFYWTTAFHEPDLRKKEVANFAFSNLSKKDGWDKSGKAVSFDKDSSYWLEVNPPEKIVKFTTPNNDGEVSKFTVEIDNAKGKLTLEDNMGNSIIIDSKEGITILSNKDVTIEAKGTLFLKASNTKVSGDMDISGQLTVSGGINTGGDIRAGTIYCSDLIKSKGSASSGGGGSSGAGGKVPAGGVPPGPEYNSGITEPEVTPWAKEVVTGDESTSSPSNSNNPSQVKKVTYIDVVRDKDGNFISGTESPWGETEDGEIIEKPTFQVGRYKLSEEEQAYRDKLHEIVLVFEGPSYNDANGDKDYDRYTADRDIALIEFWNDPANEKYKKYSPIAAHYSALTPPSGVKSKSPPLPNALAKMTSAFNNNN